MADEIRSAWGDCLIRLRKHEDALKVLEPAGEWPDQAMVRDTGTAAKRRELTRLAEALGEIEIARSWFFAALSLGPDDADIKAAWQKFQEVHPEPNAANSSIPPQRPTDQRPSTSAAPADF